MEDEKEKTLDSGIIITGRDRNEAQTGKVLAIGPDVEYVKVGDVILPNWNAAEKTRFEKEDYFLIKEEEVVEEVEAQDEPMKEQIVEEMAKPKKTVKTKTEMEESYFSKQLSEMEAKFEARLSALEAEKVALSAQNEELMERLANEPAPHTSFNPEATNDSKLNFKLGAKRAETITDRVFNQLF
mgnify:CR=1 FL=1